MKYKLKMKVMKWNKFFIVIIILLITKMAFAGCNIDLNIIPPTSDGGPSLMYYHIEHRTLDSRWIPIRKVRVQLSFWPWTHYAEVKVSIDGLPSGVQHMFRVYAESETGRGAPGDFISIPTLKDNQTYGPIDIYCGGDLGKSRSSFDASNCLFTNDVQDVQIPYRL